jgi:hypothetical protein
MRLQECEELAVVLSDAIGPGGDLTAIQSWL